MTDLCGNAIADVLFGAVNPAGRLPQTFPARLEDNPTFINYPGENGKVRYGEGIFVGYRYYEKKQVDVTNTGQRAGQEVVQLYVRDVASRLARPAKELKGFAKVALAPGETTTVKLSLGKEALAYWDDGKQAWVAEAGLFEVFVGSSSRDSRAPAGFRLTDTVMFGGPTKGDHHDREA